MQSQSRGLSPYCCKLCLKSSECLIVETINPPCYPRFISRLGPSRIRKSWILSAGALENSKIVDSISNIRDSLRMVAQRMYLWIQGLAIVTVIALFQLAPRPTASIIASVLFIVVNGFIIYWEGFRLGRKKSFSFVGTLVYAILIVLPIAGLRFFSDGALAADAQLGPFTIQKLHKLSEVAFCLVLVCYFIDLRRK